MSELLTFGRATVEYTTEAYAGINLSTGERWWGTRISWRIHGGRGHWKRFTAIDVHPFDSVTVETALRAALANARAKGDNRLREQ